MDQWEALDLLNLAQKKIHNPLLELKQILFNEQIKFIEDTSKRKAALCTRRAGKTFAGCVYLLLEAFKHPGATSLYISTRRTAENTKVTWDTLKLLNQQFELGLEFNETKLRAFLPNKSSIWLVGADDKAEIEKFRGGAYPLVIIDEGASFGAHVESLIDAVLRFALVDYDGTLAMIGTPGEIFAGKFYEVTTGLKDGWSVHKWTLFQNPHMKHAEDWVKQEVEKYGLDTEHPRVQRELFGKWVRDESRMVYAFKYNRNTYKPEELPPKLTYIIGIDLGYEDATAMVVGAFADTLPVFYVVDEFSKSHMLPQQVALKVRELVAKYEPVAVVADTGGLGKSIVEEFRQRYEIPVEAAEKSKKYEFIEMMNGDFNAGHIKAPASSQLVQEWCTLQKDDSGEEIDGIDNHLADACLYAWRESLHFLSKRLKKEPKFGTAAFYKKIEMDYIDKVNREHERAKHEVFGESL